MIKFLGTAQFVGMALLLAKSCSACDSHNLRSNAGGIDPETQKAIDDFVTKVYLPAAGITKMGLVIVKNNSEVVYSSGYGMADEAKGIPNGNQTQFLIASITKSFTALVTIKTLNERFPEMGEGVLDTPVIKLMPTLNFTLIDRFRSEHFTFRDLLAHRMCLSRNDLHSFAEPFLEESEIVYRQRYATSECGMRSEFKYNNEMYVVAGELAAILANKSYTQLIHDLLAEIGMHNSSLMSKADDFSQMPFRAQPYYILNCTSYPMNPDLITRDKINSAAGGLFVTPNDMIKYMNFHLNKGSVDGKQIIPKDVMSWMTKPSMHFSNITYRSSDEGPFTVNFAYGLALALGTFDGWEYISHSGYVPPYVSLMSLFPSQNLGIFTSSNEGPSNVFSAAVHMFIFEVLSGTSSKNAIKKLGKLLLNEENSFSERQRVRNETLEKILKIHGETTAEDNKEIVGRYGSGVLGDAEILMKSNTETNQTGLYVQYGKWYRGWMENVGGSLYKIIWDTDVIQDYYCFGDSEGFGYAGVTNKTLQFYVPLFGTTESLGNFTLGVSLDNLPTIPWDVNSC